MHWRVIPQRRSLLYHLVGQLVRVAQVPVRVLAQALLLTVLLKRTRQDTR